MTGLPLGTGVTLPLDTVTDTVGIFGTRGAGKTSTAVVLVEEAHAASLPVVILDVKGDWYGLRSASDGSGDGLPFVILGGEHGDLPLEPTAGEVVADLVVDQHPDVILDLSEMSKTKQRTFATAFAERLYRRNREALLVVVDEADVLIPQRATADTARLVGAWDDIAKRGRGRGLGMLVVTQRPQDVAKSVLDEMHTLLLHCTIGPRAVGAIKGWIADHDDDDTSRVKEVLQSLRALKPGECWAWAPQHGLLAKTRIRRIRTFDSHATPEPGVRRTQPAARAAIDLAVLGEQIAATVERAAADDPKALRARIAELEAAVAEMAPAPEPERIEVSVLIPEDRRLLGEVKALMTRVINDGSPSNPEAPLRPEDPPGVRRIGGHARILRADVEGPVESSLHTAVAADQQGRPDTEGNPVDLSKVQREVLTVLAHKPTETVANVAILTGRSATGGGFRNGLGSLRTLGYIEGRDPITITDAGIAAVGVVPPLPTGGALREHWKGHQALGRAHGLILDALATAYPRTVTVDWLAEQTGYAATGGGFRNAIGRLRTLGLIDGNNLNLAIDPSLADW